MQTTDNGKVAITFPTLGIVRFTVIGQPNNYHECTRLFASAILKMIRDKPVNWRSIR